MSRERKNLGDFGESAAVAHLERNGYAIESRNARTKWGELDIVARDGDCLVFVEVRTRTNATSGEPFETIDWRKRRRIVNLAQRWLDDRRLGVSTPCRFDIIAVVGSPNASQAIRLDHYRNAFETG